MEKSDYSRAVVVAMIVLVIIGLVIFVAY